MDIHYYYKFVIYSLPSLKDIPKKYAKDEESRKKITPQSAPFAPSSIKVQLPATKCKKEWWLEKMVCPFGYKE